MKYLLDTHVLLWWLAEKELSKNAFNIISDPKNTLFVSAATTWEITIKKGLGKLEAPDDIEDALLKNRFESLPIRMKHTLEIANLPSIHSDPFDRMIIAQAKVEGLTILSRDEHIRRYDVSLVWA